MNSIQEKQTDRATLESIARRAMVDRGLEPDFSKAVLSELKVLLRPSLDHLKIRDLRDRLWVSIDNDDSRDLDQLTLAEPMQGGRVKIFVAVADVDSLVRKGSAIDAHAWRNTTSVYTPALIFPMLPEILSTNLTSLNENQDRVAMVSEMVFDADGSLVTSDIYQAQVRNQRKLAYRSLAAWLEGGAAPYQILTILGLDENLRLQDRVAQQLAKRRRGNGSLSLETIETKAVFSGDDLSGLDVDSKNRAKQLIEDFMIAANEVNALYLAAKKFPSLRRVLRSPERWDRIVELAAGFGENLPGIPDSLALEGFLLSRRLADPEKFPDLSLAVVKLIGRGEYALDLPGGVAPGHFGLAVKDYTHSTAPNRRFPDLITQRLLKAAMNGEPLPYSLEELGELAKHCTDREDAATKVERRVRKSAEALLLLDKIGQRFDAIVTGASQKGTWVRIFQPSAEGKLDQGFVGLDVGDHVRVKLVRVDVERGFIDFVADVSSSVNAKA